MIVINGEFAKRQDASVAVALGHEITHCIVNKQLNFCGTSTEVESLCDTVGMAAAKSAGYDISHIIGQNNHDYSPKVQAQELKPFEEVLKSMNINIADKIQNTIDFYQPEKLNQLANIIDTKLIIPNNQKHENQNNTENSLITTNINYTHNR